MIIYLQQGKFWITYIYFLSLENLILLTSHTVLAKQVFDDVEIQQQSLMLTNINSNQCVATPAVRADHTQV